MKVILHSLQVIVLAITFIAGPALPSNDPHGLPGAPRPDTCGGCQPPTG
jgi:hypothetical protein